MIASGNFFLFVDEIYIHIPHRTYKDYSRSLATIRGDAEYSGTWKAECGGLKGPVSVWVSIIRLRKQLHRLTGTYCYESIMYVTYMIDSSCLSQQAQALDPARPLIG